MQPLLEGAQAEAEEVPGRAGIDLHGLGDELHRPWREHGLRHDLQGQGQQFHERHRVVQERPPAPEHTLHGAHHLVHGQARRAELERLSRRVLAQRQLGQQATSAFLLWATAAKECEELTRDCVLEQLHQITSWDAGGLHAESNPGENLPPECSLLLKLDGTEWVQVYPEEPGEFACDPDGSFQLSGRVVDQAQLGEDPLGSGDRGRFAVESYLDHHAGKLARRFDANSYLVLTEAMNSHDVGRDRGGLPAALSRVRAQCTIASVDTDRLYPPRLSDELHQLLPRSVRAHISSPYGHDGFLIEDDQVGAIIRTALASDPSVGEVTTG